MQFLPLFRGLEAKIRIICREEILAHIWMVGKKFGPPWTLYTRAQHDIEALTKENVFLKNSFLELESKLNASKEKTKVLEEKGSTSEGEALKVHEQIRKWKESTAKKDDEIKCLKNVIKNNNTNISKLEVEKNESKKDVKKKEKEVLEIGKANQVHQKTIQTLKEELKKHKVDKNEVDKRNKQLEKKVEGLQLKIQSLMNNNNMLPSTSVLFLCEMFSLWKTLLGCSSLKETFRDQP